MPGSASAPALLPMLSRGKHRNIRKGACFMEMASMLAGERWSDHPRCTHPLLAELARLVNDSTSDDQRHRLGELVPAVIGLTSEDIRMDARIALRCAQVALPVVSQERQNVLAVGILTAESVLASADQRPDGTLERRSHAALEAAPHAARWGYEFVRRVGMSGKGFRRHAAPATVRIAVTAIAEACVADPDAMLRDLLSEVITDCIAITRPEEAGNAITRAEAAAAHAIV